MYVKFPTHCKTSATFHNIRTSSYVTMVYQRSESQGRTQKNHFDYIVRGHFETETSKSEPGTTNSRFRFRYRWNRCSFNSDVYETIYRSINVRRPA